jgi:hypothetical protein
MTVLDMNDHHPYEFKLEQIAAAFAAVFPDEKLRIIECGPDPDSDREIFVIKSDKLVRRYARIPGQSFEEVLRTVPHIDVSKVY